MHVSTIKTYIYCMHVGTYPQVIHICGQYLNNLCKQVHLLNIIYYSITISILFYI